MCLVSAKCKKKNLSAACWLRVSAKLLFSDSWLRQHVNFNSNLNVIFISWHRHHEKLLHKFPPKNPLQHSVLIGLHQSVCLYVCVWHIQHSNCVSLVGQRGIGVLNPILNLYLSYRGGEGGCSASTNHMSRSPIQRDWIWMRNKSGVLASPLVAGLESVWECLLICSQTGSGTVDTSTAKLRKICFNDDKIVSMALRLWAFCCCSTQSSVQRGGQRGWLLQNHHKSSPESQQYNTELNWTD